MDEPLASTSRENAKDTSREEFNRLLVLRHHLEDLKQICQNPDIIEPKICNEKMRNLILEMNGMYSNTNPPTSDELVLDLHVTANAGKVIREHCLSAADTSKKFNENEFVDKLRNKFFQNDKFDLCALGILGRSMLKPAPGYLSLMGHLAVDEKELPVKEKRVREARKDKKTEVEKAVKLTQAPQKMELGVDEIVVRVGRLLKEVYSRNGNQPLCYFKFVIDPSSFAKSVQNMFHVSFLVRDGHAAMDLDAYGSPVISPVTSASHEEVSFLPKKQMITSFSVKDWRELIEAYEITESIM